MEPGEGPSGEVLGTGEGAELHRELARDSGDIFKRRIAENKGEFTEALEIKPDGQLRMEDKDGNIRSLFAYLGHQGPEDLYQAARLVEEEHHDLLFTFDRAEDGKSITYTVRKKVPATVS